MHVVQRADRDRGLERSRLGLEVGERDAVDVPAARLGIDRGDDVAGRRQRRRQLPLAGADLQHPARGWRQVRAHEGEDVVAHDSCQTSSRMIATRPPPGSMPWTVTSGPPIMVS